MIFKKKWNFVEDILIQQSELRLMSRSHLRVKAIKTIFLKLSGMWLSCGSYRVYMYVAVMESTSCSFLAKISLCSSYVMALCEGVTVALVKTQTIFMNRSLLWNALSTIFMQWNKMIKHAWWWLIKQIWRLDDHRAMWINSRNMQSLEYGAVVIKTWNH